MDLRAFIFLPALVASTICVFLLLTFAANHYLTVMQSTAAGARDVEWVSEPLVDSFGKVFYLGWLIGLWMGPAYFLGRAFATSSDPAWVRLAIPLAFFWICYPVSQLSSLSASTMWLPLHPEVLARLAQKPGVVLGFQGLSAAVLALFGVGLHWTFGVKGQSELLFIGAPLLVVSVLVYARLLGRLAFALSYTKPVFVRKKRKKPKREETFAEPRPPETEEGFEQPRDLPPIRTKFEGELTGYDVKFDEPPKAKKRVVAEADDSPPPPRKKDRKRPGSERSREWTDEDEDANPYGVHEAEATPEPARATEVVKPSPLEMRLMAKDEAPKPPKETWSPQLLAFLVHPQTIPIVGLLVVVCLVAGGFVRLARAYNPVG
jgi:hypothetical protein